ncbi:MAG: 4-(cytidine 5'-diphospho)-2-C-methyl-D-erythritol kinase [Bacteroidota bacterium]
MISFPNAKINLGLNILSKRPDGYHNISSCFYPIPFYDVLEIVKSTDFEFKTTGLSIPGNGNLCVQAFEILKQDYNIQNVKIHLHKVIPIGAGLGGGSADATFTLKMLNAIFELELDDFVLEKYAAKLGSDCPFFVKNAPVLALSTGTEFHNLDINLKEYFLVLVSPHVHISTVEAYSGVTPKNPSIKLSESLKQPLTFWKSRVINDFEGSIFPKHPEISSLKEQMYQQGAIYASMTGSGSAVYGLFESEPDLSELKDSECWSGHLK